MERPVLLGMNNPLSVRPEHALWPSPPGCAGYRLWQMVSDGVPGGVSVGSYVRVFDRRNVLRGPWDQRAARRAASGLTRDLRGRSVVVLGNQAREALGLPRLLVHPQVIDDVTWRQLPHPSGRNRWYNDPGCRELASQLLASLYTQYVEARQGEM